MRQCLCLVGAALAVFISVRSASAETPVPPVDAQRLRLYEAWHKLPMPPISPYDGPFARDCRAFIGQLKEGSELWKAYYDWKRLGAYDPEKDNRPIDRELEAAVLEDWRRMGYNTAYKGYAFSFRAGRWLKKQGMLGAIDQTELAFGLYGQNFSNSVEHLANYVKNFGDPDMVKVGDVYLTCSWDEFQRHEMDNSPEAVSEYRRYLKEVWFQDETPDQDTNKDGRTYDQFTGEAIKRWDDVKPPASKWAATGAWKLWVDFYRYSSFEYFRRVNAAASASAGKTVECYPFPLAFIMWPCAGASMGLSLYWNTRLNPVLNVEQCWPEHPSMLLNYAQTDHAARKYKNLVMGWSWFLEPNHPPDFYPRQGDIERALARMMGHRVDGIHHFRYSEFYRSTHQMHRLQLAYWHNFLSKHYATFLASSAPPTPQVALLMPDYTGYYYPAWNYPQGAYAYTAEALMEAQIPFEIVCEEELELESDALQPYKVLYVVGGEWTTPLIRKRIEAFIAAGGHVFCDNDSLSLDIPTGERTDFLARTFGVQLQHKYKNPFFSSIQTPEEEAFAVKLRPLMMFQRKDLHVPGVFSPLWKQEGGEVVRAEDAWKKLDAVLDAMPRTGRGGLAQSPIDMRQPPKIRYAPGLGPEEGLIAFGEIDVGKVVKGKPIAWYGDDVCAVETERTVWLGAGPGASMHALAQRMSLSQGTEPCNPFVPQVSDDYAAHKPYVDLVAYAARRAGVKPVVTLKLNGQIPCNLEVLPRADAQGNLMVVVVNHDETQAAYAVEIRPDYVKNTLPSKAAAWDLLGQKLIEEATDGVFDFAVAPHRAAMFMVAAEPALGRVKEAQARLDAMDLSVPKYYRDRPELNVDHNQ